MKNPLYLLRFSIALLLILTIRCANQQPPTGGPKDETSPKFIRSIPKDSTTNFRGRLMVFEFDENIKLINFKKELIVSPNTDLKYKTRIKKNILTLELIEPLADSTTYSFNFGGGIGDVNEGNLVDSLKIAFSTWDILDTLSINGEVRNIENGLTIANALVALYYPEDTLKIYGKKPLYYTFTNEEGKYAITNLSPKSYSIFAFVDGNKSFSYDLPSEKIAFQKEYIKLRQNIDSLVLLADNYDTREFIYKGTKKRKGHYELIFSKGLTSYQFSTEKKIDSLYSISTADKIQLYYLGSKVFADSLNFTAQVVDSLDNTLLIEDKIFLPIEGNKEIKLNDFNFTAVSPASKTFNGGETIELQLQFTRPIAQFEADSAVLIKGTDTLAINKDQVTMNADKTLLTFNKIKIDSASSYQFKASTFISVFNDTLSAKNVSFSLKDPTKHGSIEGKVETTEPHYFVQLLNQTNKVEAELKSPTTFVFNMVSPGIKRIRVFVDENNNGVWDKGNLKERIPAEKVVFYPYEIEVKENWEIRDEELVIRF